MVPSFNEWVRDQGHAPNGKWVLARNTARIRERYPDSTVFSPARYDALVEEHRVLVRDDQLDRLWFDNGAPNGVRELLTEAFELGRAAQ